MNKRIAAAVIFGAALAVTAAPAQASVDDVTYGQTRWQAQHEIGSKGVALTRYISPVDGKAVLFKIYDTFFVKYKADTLAGPWYVTNFGGGQRCTPGDVGC